jgi:hypothetical protein
VAPRNDEPAPLGASQGASIKAHAWMMLMDKRFGLHEANHDFGLVVFFSPWNFYADFTLLSPRRGTRPAAIAFYRTVTGWA